MLWQAGQRVWFIRRPPAEPCGALGPERNRRNSATLLLAPHFSGRPHAWEHAGTPPTHQSTTGHCSRGVQGPPASRDTRWRTVAPPPGAPRGGCWARAAWAPRGPRRRRRQRRHGSSGPARAWTRAPPLGCTRLLHPALLHHRTNCWTCRRRPSRRAAAAAPLPSVHTPAHSVRRAPRPPQTRPARRRRWLRRCRQTTERSCGSTRRSWRHARATWRHYVCSWRRRAASWARRRPSCARRRSRRSAARRR